MKQINITVNGPIGSGKTTFINSLADGLSRLNYKVLIQKEPSVVIPFINEALTNFYNNQKTWAYPLQLLIAAAQESYMQELRDKEYDFAIVDAAWSSSIYGYSHLKEERVESREFSTLDSLNRSFSFDYLFWLDPGLKRIKKNVQKRNNESEGGTLKNNQKDIPVDLSYLDSHYQDFNEYKPIYFSKFRSFNKNIKINELNDIPDFSKSPDGEKKYWKFIEDIIYKIEWDTNTHTDDKEE